MGQTRLGSRQNMFLLFSCLLDQIHVGLWAKAFYMLFHSGQNLWRTYWRDSTTNGHKSKSKILMCRAEFILSGSYCLVPAYILPEYLVSTKLFAWPEYLVSSLYRVTVTRPLLLLNITLDYYTPERGFEFVAGAVAVLYPTRPFDKILDFNKVVAVLVAVAVAVVPNVRAPGYALDWKKVLF